MSFASNLLFFFIIIISKQIKLNVLQRGDSLKLKLSRRIKKGYFLIIYIIKDILLIYCSRHRVIIILYIFRETKVITEKAEIKGAEGKAAGSTRSRCG